MPLRTGAIDEPTVNLTPMVDIVFLLVIFFLVGAQFTDRERQVEIELPTASATAAPLTDPPDEIVVNLDAAGQLFLADRPVTPAELERELVVAKARFADQPVRLRGDGGVDYAAVMRALDLIKGRAGLEKIALSVELEESEEPRR